MRSLFIFLAVLFVILQYELWFGNGGVATAMHVHHEMDEQKKQNDILQKQNMELITEIKNFKSNKDAIESKARSDLGMIKKGEIFYQVTK